MPWRTALRDLVILALALAVWQLEGTSRHAGGAGATALACSAAVLTALCGYLFHEWGHWAGARLLSSVIEVPDRFATVFLFRFDADANDRAQFLGMSFGGFVASAVAVAILVAVLPLDAPAGRIALALVALGVLATFVLEVPVAWRVARGAPIPRGAAYRSTARVPDPGRRTA